MSDRSSGQETRRRFLKMTGAGTVAVTLAGCSGDGDGGGGGGGDGNGDSNGDGGDDDTSGDGSGGSGGGTTIEFWDVINVQSDTARETIDQYTQQWEEESGNTVEFNYSSYDNLGGPQWVQAFENGNGPIAYNGDAGFTGTLTSNDMVRPVGEWIDELDSEIRNNFADQVVSATAYNYRGYADPDPDAGEFHEFPIAWTPRNPFMIRTDLWEEAGLDPEEEFPPQDSEDLMEKARILMENSSAEYGFEIYGDAFDYNDIMQIWAQARGGTDGLYLNEDWSDTNFDNDVWKGVANDYYSFVEEGLTSPNAPSQTDETMVDFLNNGQVGIAQPEILNHPDFMSRAGDKMESGDIRYGPMWSGESGQRGVFGVWSAAFPTQESTGLSDSEYQEKFDAAIDYLNDTWYSREWQQEFPWTIGMYPVREDTWDYIKENMPGEEGHRYAETCFTMAEDIEYSWNNHPSAIAINFEIPGRFVPDMLSGNTSPDETMDKIAEAVRSEAL